MSIRPLARPWFLGILFLGSAYLLWPHRGQRAGDETVADRPPVILITVDTLRRDYVSFYADPPLPTPAIDRIGREGGAADLAVAPYGRTTQSVGTILTGLHPLRHGADGLGMELPAAVITLAEHFAANGYETVAFASNRNLRPGLGFDQGFELYSSDPDHYSGNCAQELTDQALAWLEEWKESERPLFLWAHYLDPHWGYKPPEELAKRADPSWTRPIYLADWEKLEGLKKGDILFHGGDYLTDREVEHTRRLYSAEVAATDREVGRLVAGLEQRGLLDRALVCITSDHGEGTGEHDFWFGHGEYIYEGVLRVPLLFRSPGRIPAGARVEGVVRLEDVAPTIWELAGLEVPAGLDGRSFADLLRSGETRRVPAATALHLSDHRLVRKENPRQPVRGRAGQWWAIRQDGYKLIRIPLGDDRFEEELYDLSRDPEERENLAALQPEVVDRLRADLLTAQASRRLPEVEPPGPSEKDLEALRSLGYID